MGKIEQERCISTDYETDSCLIIPFELQKMLEDKYGMDDFYGASIQQGVTVACDRCADTWKNIEGNYDALNHC